MMAFQMYKHLKVEYGGPNHNILPGSHHEMPSTSQTHNNIRVPINHLRFKCDTCGKLYMNTEIHESFQNGISKYYCYECVDKLTEDLMKPGERPAQNFTYQQCTVCSKTTNPCSYYKSGYNDEPFRCDVCSKKPTETETKSVVVTKREKMFDCDICMKQFTQMAHLKTHKLIHSGEKAFQCDICYKRFTRKSGLDVHKLIHSGEKSYKCDVCHMRFVQPSHLKTHQLTHSGEKPFECEICFKRFGRKSGLDVHKLIHSGEKSYECDICLKRFIQPSHLNTHKLVHTGEKPFQCNICLKRFNRAALLRKHQLSHTK